jgi:protein tyrosine/serine phosphatase
MKNKFCISIFFVFIHINAYALGGTKSVDLPMFYEVIKNSLYRGGAPTDNGIQELANMHFQTVLSIRDEDPARTEYEKKLVKKLGMRFISIPISVVFSPSHQKIEEIELALNNQKFYPIFVHCTLGEDRTGLAIGLYRVFYQNVTPKAAYDEMLSFGFHPILIGLKHYFEEATEGKTPNSLIRE